MKTIWQNALRSTSAIVLSALTFPALAASTVIDVLVVYTDGAAALYGGDPTTRINQLFQVTNQIYADSGVDLEVRVAKTMKVNYTDDNAAETALNAITLNQDAAFSGIAAARDQAKADMVVLYRPFKQIHGSCGVAWVAGSNGSMTGHKGYMFAHVAINSCGDFVTSHEMGHNMGLKHSRKQDGVGGVFPYALGYGVMNVFTDIMAYQDQFNVDYWTGKVYKFSNPDILCKNLPCGVDRNNATSGADARYALNITAPQIANFYAGAPASSSSSSSRSSSSTPASSASSKSSSSVGSVSTTDAMSLKTKMEAARVVHSAAVDAVNANKLAITDKATIERTAKTELATATKNLTTATKNYEKAVTKYNGLVAKVNPLTVQLNTAMTAYNSASTTAAKSTKLTAYNSLVAKYNDLAAQITAALNEANAAQQLIAPATAAVTTATAAYDAAVAASTAEKAKTENLKLAVTNALAAFKALELEYKAALKACKCTV